MQATTLETSWACLLLQPIKLQLSIYALYCRAQVSWLRYAAFRCGPCEVCVTLYKDMSKLRFLSHFFPGDNLWSTDFVRLSELKMPRQIQYLCARPFSSCWYSLVCVIVWMLLLAEDLKWVCSGHLPSGHLYSFLLFRRLGQGIDSRNKNNLVCGRKLSHISNKENPAAWQIRRATWLNLLCWCTVFFLECAEPHIGRLFSVRTICSLYICGIWDLFWSSSVRSQRRTRLFLNMPARFTWRTRLQLLMGFCS